MYSVQPPNIERNGPITQERCPECGGDAVRKKKDSPRSRERDHPEDYFCGSCLSHFDAPQTVEYRPPDTEVGNDILKALGRAHAGRVVCMADGPVSHPDIRDSGGIPNRSARLAMDALVDTGGLASIGKYPRKKNHSTEYYVRPKDALVIDFRGERPRAFWEWVGGDE